MKVKKFELYSKDTECYFVFAPCVYALDKYEMSFGLELFGRRFFYTDIRWRW